MHEIFSLLFLPFSLSLQIFSGDVHEEGKEEKLDSGARERTTFKLKLVISSTNIIVARNNAQ